MNHDRFLKNLQWLFESRERLGLYVILNFNELRQNWFEIPMIFRFAAQNSCRVHTNHCVGPEFCTIYDLPRRELLYVQEFLVRQREELKQELVAHENHLPYDHLLVNIAARLDAGAEPTWSPEFRAYLENRERGASDAAGDPEEFGAFLTEKVMTDGLLTAPIPGQEPFETPAKVAAEITRIVELGGPVAVRLLTAIEKTVAILGSEWAPVGVEIAGARRRVAASIDRPASHTSAAAGG
jgi:hypothetical protein